MGRKRLISRYCHLNPSVKQATMEQVLSYVPKHFRWAGCDLFCTTTALGHRRMVVVETNSCPSGNKSMPLLSEENEQGGFRTLIETTFLPLIKRRTLEGALAVIYDKNYTEASGYACALADLTGEAVYLSPFPQGAEGDAAATWFEDRVLYVRDTKGEVQPIRAAFRYVTQRPWSRIPVNTKTQILNPVISCLAGGRNKLVASKAYDFLNAELEGTGLRVREPETIRDVRKAEIPLLVQRFGGQVAIKIPYSNAGQGVFTITSQQELNDFMAREDSYDTYIVQSLIGNATWSSATRQGRFYHVGTMPDKKGRIYVADIRIAVCAGPNGFKPLAVYARRAAEPLKAELDGSPSWGMLGTNLSTKAGDGGWNADTERLLLMDQRDFNTLGISADDLIEGFVQTVLAATAIDKMAQALIGSKGGLRRKLFRSLNDDAALLEEILVAKKSSLTTPPGAS